MRRKQLEQRWQQIERDWNAFKPQAKRAWPGLHDAELEVVGGRREKLIDKVRDAQSVSHEAATREVDAWAAGL